MKHKLEKVASSFNIHQLEELAPVSKGVSRGNYFRFGVESGTSILSRWLAHDSEQGFTAILSEAGRTRLGSWMCVSRHSGCHSNWLILGYGGQV